jgi:TPR repeat protein
LWLQQAADQSANARAMLGECYRQGCDDSPPAPARAAEQFIEAARSGVRLAHRGLSNLAEDHPDVVARATAYAWRSVSRRLNEQGCYGLAYIRYYIEDAREMPVLRARLGGKGQEDADRLAEQFWTQYGGQARENLGCAQ